MAPDKLGVGVLLCTCLLHGTVTFGVNNVSGRSIETTRSTETTRSIETAESGGTVTNQTKLATNQNQFEINNRGSLSDIWSSACVTSPGYPNDYPDNSNSRQAMSVAAGRAIEVTFKDFDVEAEDTCNYDYLEFFDANSNSVGKKLCGKPKSLPEKFTISTSTVTAVFRSDGSVRRKGFKFCYQPVDIDEKCVTSPGYPNDYPNNAHHFKALTVAAGKAIEITFHEFDVEEEDSCSYDYLQFVKNSEKLCGNNLPGKLVISTNTAILEFRSDDSVRRKGYKFCYKPVTQSTNECGKENPARRISGGSFTRAHQYPWMVRLPSGCGGALVTDSHVLMAKHCVDHGNWRGTKAKVAVHDQHDPNDYEEVVIKDYVWPDGNDHDIAIVILEAPVDFNDINIGTVCLPSSANKDYRGKEALAMGWGWTPETSSQSRLLQKLKLTVTQRQARNWLWTDVVFKGGIPLDVCRGDSGGPLVYKEGGKWTVIGTVSGGAYCDNHTGQDGLWNKVTDHLQWIKNVIGQ